MVAGVEGAVRSEVDKGEVPSSLCGADCEANDFDLFRVSSHESPRLRGRAEDAFAVYGDWDTAGWEAIMPASDIKFLLRIPVALDAKLRSRAGSEGRSLNGTICEILTNVVAGEEQRMSTARTRGVRPPPSLPVKNTAAGDGPPKCPTCGGPTKDWRNSWLCEKGHKTLK